MDGIDRIKKISVIGIGGVGTYAACFSARLAEKMVIYNRRRSDDDERVDGLLRDMCDALSCATDCNITGSNFSEDLAGSDVIVIAIGLGREYAFETRDMLFFKNAALIKSTMNDIKKVSPAARVIIATNPVDYMGIIAKNAGLPEQNIFCLGGELDTARLTRYICDALTEKTGRFVNPCEINDIYVVGSHGPNMIPVLSNGKFEGKYLKDIFNAATIEAIKKNTKSEGATITRKKGKSAVIGPGAAIAAMIEKGINGREFLAHTYLNNKELKQLGIDLTFDQNIFMGIPFKLKPGGREVTPIIMSDEEKSDLIKFIDAQNDRNQEVEIILSKTQEGLSTTEKINNFISFLSQKGVIIKPIVGEDGGHEIYREGEDPQSAVSMNIWKYI